MVMYDGNACITLQEWYDSGLTADQFKKDSRAGLLKIARRGLQGSTLIIYNSIVREERKKMIEGIVGKSLERLAAEPKPETAVANTEDAEWLRSQNLGEETVRKCLAQIGVFRSIQEHYGKAVTIHAQLGTRVRLKEFWNGELKWQIRETLNDDGRFAGATTYKNVTSLQRAFKRFTTEGRKAVLPKNLGNTNGLKAVRPVENLILALWRMHDKPFCRKVYDIYHQWLSGGKTVYDQETGEVFSPEDYDAKPVSDSTIWRILHSNDNYTAVYPDRNGHFDYQNALRPKHRRKHGTFSLSKISMDDVALSRHTAKGWAYKYIAVDVVSGYYFRPAYVMGKPNADTVIEAFRYMFIELMELGLGIPMELEVEHHLMSNFDFLDQLFPFVRFCNSPTEKRAEHNIKSLKWGTAKKNGHTRGRWYAKHEAYRSIRTKVDGDYPEPEYDLRTVIADDLSDIEKHNNELHPDQKNFPGMTRRDVLIKCKNPNCQKIEPKTLFRYIGNETATSIRNNDYVRCCNGEYGLTDFAGLNKLKPNNKRVTAYWLPNDDGSVGTVYLWQGDTFIGEAENRENYAYNECQAERTEEDEAKMLEQNKRIAKFDKMMRERRKELPKVGILEEDVIEEEIADKADEPSALQIQENPQPKGYEEDEFSSEYDSEDLGAWALELM